MSNPTARSGPKACGAQHHIIAIEHWARADRGQRGEELRAAATFIAHQQELQDALRDFVRLVLAGLKRGNVKSKPIITFSSDAESLPMESLDEIATALLAKVQSTDTVIP